MRLPRTRRSGWSLPNPQLPLIPRIHQAFPQGFIASVIAAIRCKDLRSNILTHPPLTGLNRKPLCIASIRFDSTAHSRGGLEYTLNGSCAVCQTAHRPLPSTRYTTAVPRDKLGFRQWLGIVSYHQSYYHTRVFSARPCIPFETHLVSDVY
jgi:hypothetical protein